MELKDFSVTRGKLVVMVIAVMIITAVSQLSGVHNSTADEKESGAVEIQTIEQLDNTIKQLTFDDEFTIRDPYAERNSYVDHSQMTAAGMNVSSSMTNMQASNRTGTPRLSENADSLIYENDSTFTIEGYKQELSQDGDWIKVSPAEVDPEGVVDNSGGFDSEINTDYVWRPRNVGAGWSPYTNGYWSYTNCGWMWISYYNWGWRPYHYGRWWWSSYYGWVWSPGFIFAPAWVVWMYNDGYCGWYPISPRIRCGYGYGYGYDYGYRCHGMRYRVRHWNFCHKKDFANPLNPPVLVVDPMYNGEIIKTTKYDGTLGVSVTTGVNNNGPTKQSVEEASGKQVTTKDITPYTTKNVTTKNDGRKKDEGNNQNSKEYNPPNDVNNNGKVKDNGGNNTKQDQNNTKQDQNNTKQDQNNTKQDQNNGKQDQNTNDQNTNTRKDDNSKRDEDYQKEYQRKQREKEKEKEKDSYTPPPTKKNDPPKDTYKPPKKETYTPPKQDNPPKKDNPPPKKDTYTPPKNDNPPRKESPPPKRDNPPPKNDNGNKSNDGNNSKGK